MVTISEHMQLPYNVPEHPRHNYHLAAKTMWYIARSRAELANGKTSYTAIEGEREGWIARLNLRGLLAELWPQVEGHDRKIVFPSLRNHLANVLILKQRSYDVRQPSLWWIAGEWAESKDAATSSTIYECTVCARKFRGKQGLSNHITVTHMDTRRTNDTITIKNDVSINGNRSQVVALLDYIRELETKASGAQSVESLKQRIREVLDQF